MKNCKIGLASLLFLILSGVFSNVAFSSLISEEWLRKLRNPFSSVREPPPQEQSQTAPPRSPEAPASNLVGRPTPALPAQNLPSIQAKGVELVVQKNVQDWCGELSRSFGRLKWKLDPCSNIEWVTGGHSVKGMPLVYADFGDKQAENVTLVLSAVHGDEVTPIYLGIRLVHWMMEHNQDFGKTRVIIAPLVNPDGFFSTPRTRVNARGVDINRNFATRDWKKIRAAYNSRRFPGKVPRSEPETLFQEELIRMFKPQKILSVHSPLNFLDYDGPGTFTLSRFPKDYTRECIRLKKDLKAISGGFYPGSLGNFAGFEMGIPTLTLELPSADPAKAKEYWERFSQGIHKMINFTVPVFTASEHFAPADLTNKPSTTKEG